MCSSCVLKSFGVWKVRPVILSSTMLLPVFFFCACVCKLERKKKRKKKRNKESEREKDLECLVQSQEYDNTLLRVKNWKDLFFFSLNYY